MGYQDWQASDRDTKNAVAAANTAKTAADTAIANANKITAKAPGSAQEAARQQAAVDAANAAVAAYNAAADTAAKASMFSTDWFGLGTDFLKSTGLDKNVYTPTVGLSGGNVQAISKYVVNSYYVGSGANRMLVTVYSDGSIERTPAPETTAEQSGSSTEVLKSILKGMGFNSKIIDASTTFLESLISEGLDYDNAVSVFLNSKDYTTKAGTKLESPFYTEYGYLNEGLVNPKTAAELYNAVEGYKGIVDKYSLNQKFISSESLKAYVKNNVTVADLDERANTARLKAISADTGQVNALIKLGYISTPDQLTDFYLNPNIGKETLEQNRITGAFTAEALRRANAGIQFDKERFTQYGAMLTQKGLTEAQAGQVAGQAFETIGEQLKPLTAYSQMYEKTGGTEQANAQLAGTIQQELESEQLLGMASQRRKRLSEQATLSFQAKPGLASTALNTRGTAGLL